MRTVHTLRLLAAAIILSAAGGALAPHAEAKPGGKYRCQAKNLLFNGIVWGPNTPLILRVPNGKGALSGSFKGAGTIGLAGNTPISGRIRKARSARGGKRVILRGNWTWKLSQNFLSGDARGSVRLVLNAFRRGRGYKIKAPIKVRNNGATPYLVTGKLTGKK